MLLLLLEPPSLPSASQKVEKLTFQYTASDASLAVLRLIAGLENLPANWDGEGAEVIQPSVVGGALSFVSSAYISQQMISEAEEFLPSVNPIPNNGIDILWEKPSGHLLVTIRQKPNENEPFALYHGQKNSEYQPSEIKGLEPLSKIHVKLIDFLIHL